LILICWAFAHDLIIGGKIAASLRSTAPPVSARRIKLYQRCGFVLYGLEPMAIRVGDEYLDKVHMWLEL
jgi:hypothetical protein